MRVYHNSAKPICFNFVSYANLIIIILLTALIMKQFLSIYVPNLQYSNKPHSFSSTRKMFFGAKNNRNIFCSHHLLFSSTISRNDCFDNISALPDPFCRVLWIFLLLTPLKLNQLNPLSTPISQLRIIHSNLNYAHSPVRLLLLSIHRAVPHNPS